MTQDSSSKPPVGTVIRNLLLAAAAAGVGGCDGGQQPQPAPTEAAPSRAPEESPVGPMVVIPAPYVDGLLHGALNIDVILGKHTIPIGPKSNEQIAEDAKLFEEILSHPQHYSSITVRLHDPSGALPDCPVTMPIAEIDRSRERLSQLMLEAAQDQTHLDVAKNCDLKAATEKTLQEKQQEEETPVYRGPMAALKPPYELRKASLNYDGPLGSKDGIRLI